VVYKEELPPGSGVVADNKCLKRINIAAYDWRIEFRERTVQYV
jgi:hypothetical protein